MTWTTKQREVIDCYRNEQPKILICSGAKRAGKTFVLSFIFLAHIARFKNKKLSFILGGAAQSSIRRNILDDWELLLGREIKLDINNSFKLFGNKVYCFEGSKADAWKKPRGFTAAGALLNEATALHDTFVKEVMSRCSYPGARVFMDTNPENPAHTVKTDYIDKDGQRLKNGRLNIKAFHFTLFDNDTLDPEYVESIVMSTPSGMYTDRDIYGRWVAAEGVVYKDFNKDIHFISRAEAQSKNFVSFFCGVDWGYEHYGVIVLIGRDDEDNYYLLEEYAEQHQEIDYWVDVAKDIKARYGNITFYCDSARPEHVQRFKREQLQARYADKAVLSGIEVVAKGFKQNRLYIVDDAKRFKSEIYMYVWDPKTGEPVKQLDDVLDALRYALYTSQKATGIRFL